MTSIGLAGNVFTIASAYKLDGVNYMKRRRKLDFQKRGMRLEDSPDLLVCDRASVLTAADLRDSFVSSKFSIHHIRTRGSANGWRLQCHFEPTHTAPRLDCRRCVRKHVIVYDPFLIVSTYNGNKNNPS